MIGSDDQPRAPAVMAGDTVVGDPETGGAPDTAWMRRAISLGEAVRGTTAPNPWVGALLCTDDGDGRPAGEQCVTGATQPPGGPHAEIVALERARAAGQAVERSVLYVTLEPCAHHGRTPPCADAIVAAGIRHVVVGVLDPDPQVAGQGVERLRAGGVTVRVGECGHEVEESLAPYLKHRRTGRPWVVLKLAATLDGRIAAPDGSSRWITGPEARADAHRLRARANAVVVGAGTVRADDPELTVRIGPEPRSQPLRVVLGHAPANARVQPALELQGDLGDVLDELGARGVLEVLVEGGARVAHGFHAAGLVDRYVVYLAPALFGGDDARPMFMGPAAGSVADLWRGKLVSVDQLGADIRVEVAA